jgi:putative transposase
MLLRLAYLGITNAFALLRMLPGDGRDKDIEILSLRHQLAVLQRQLAGKQVRFEPVDRAWLAVLLNPLPRPTLRRLRLLVQPDTILKWHRELIARRHAAVSRPRRRGRPRTLRSIRALVLRLARENGSWGYRRVHGELLTLGVMVAPSTVWEILREAGIDPAPDRAATTWTGFLRSQADALLAADFTETVTLTGARMYILTVIEHASRRIRVLGVTAHPTAAWVGQAARNLVMDLEDAGGKATYLIRGRGQVSIHVRRDPGRRRHQRRAHRYPDAPHERDHGSLGADLPTRVAGPHADLEPAAPAACAAGVRTFLQRPPTASGDRKRAAAETAARTDHRPGPTCPAEHPPA